MHSIAGYPVDHFKNYLINLSLKGMSRLKPRQVKRAAPIIIDILMAIYEDLDFQNPQMLFIGAYFFLSFFC